MTDEQIKTCIQEIAFKVTAPAAFGGDGAGVRLLAIELLDYREARAAVDAKGYNETGRTLAKLVQLLPDKAPEPKCQDGKCVHRSRPWCPALLGICPDNKNDFMLGDHCAYDDVEVGTVPDIPSIPKPPKPKTVCRKCEHWDRNAIGCRLRVVWPPDRCCESFVSRAVPDKAPEPEDLCGECRHVRKTRGLCTHGRPASARDHCEYFELPDKPKEPNGRCGDCGLWAALALAAKPPAYLRELDIGIGVCVESKAMKLKTSRMHCDDFEARK